MLRWCVSCLSCELQRSVYRRNDKQFSYIPQRLLHHKHKCCSRPSKSRLMRICFLRIHKLNVRFVNNFPYKSCNQTPRNEACTQFGRFPGQNRNHNKTFQEGNYSCTNHILELLETKRKNVLLAGGGGRGGFGRQSTSFPSTNHLALQPPQ